MKSEAVIQRNKEIWTKNLVQFQKCQKRRGMVPFEEFSLGDNTRMPMNIQIIGRYQFLGANIKGRKERIVVISKEIKTLWNMKLNFPHLSDQAIRSKIGNILKSYDECVKRGKFDPLYKAFDVTKLNGPWLCNEDKQLYHIQLESNGHVGYSTGKVANKNTIHPSKRLQLNELSAPELSSKCFDNILSNSDYDDSNYDDRSDVSSTHTRRYSNSHHAANLVIGANISTRKAAKICQQLSLDGIDIPTPSQAAIYKATFVQAVKMKDKMKKMLKMEQWCLHFDGKKLLKSEYQVVVLTNERTEIKLEALCLKDGKAQTISHGIGKLIDEYELWNSIKMIICDTTSVNTGKKVVLSSICKECFPIRVSRSHNLSVASITYLIEFSA